MFGLRQQLARQCRQRLVATMQQRRFGAAAAEAAPAAKPTPPPAPHSFADKWTAQEEQEFQRFCTEMNKQHPTNSFDRSKFSPYSEEELQHLNAPPKYSRPFYDVFGRKRSPRVVFLFPTYFTLFMIFEVQMSRAFGVEWHSLPLKKLLEAGQESH